MGELLQSLGFQFPAFIWAVVNLLILIGIILIPVWVFKDARNRGLTELVSLIWALVSIFTFPLGLILYFVAKSMNAGKA